MTEREPEATMDRVEKVARAITPLLAGDREDAHGNDLPPMTFDELTPDWQRRYLDIAQAAIAALDATPTETADERQAAIVAWLREQAKSEWLNSTQQHLMDNAARAIESGEWRRT